MKILVVGAGGFIGRNLIDYINLKREKYDRVALITRRPFRMTDFEIYPADLLEPLDIPFKANLIIHLAAQADPTRGDVFDDNISMTKNVLSYAKKVGAAVAFTSSSSIYGNRSGQQKEIPTSLYGASKAGCEKLVMAECNLNNLGCYIFNLTANYGKYATHGMCKDIRRKVLEEEKIVCWGNWPGTCKPLMNVAETVRLMMEDLEWYADINQSRFLYRHIHPLNPISVKTVVEIMQEHYGTNKPVEWNGETYNGDNPYVFPSPDPELEMRTSQEYLLEALKDVDKAQG